MKRTCSFLKLPALATVVFLIITYNPLLAQQTVAARDDFPPAPGSTSSSSTTIASKAEPVTLQDQWTYYRQSTYSPTALLFPALTAGYNQLINDPREWQQGTEGYGKRLASAYGSLAVENTISFGIAALNGEDLRYVRSTYPKKQVFKRAGYAIAHTFISRRNAEKTFAWSRMAGDYGSGFVTNQWYPERTQSVHNSLYLGTWNLVGDAGSNLFHEFFRPHFVFGPKHSKP